MHGSILFTLALASSVFAAPSGPTPVLVPRAVTTTFPTAAGHTSLATPITVAAGTVFDGQMWRYDRGPGACLGQREGDDKDAVFLVEKGATLKNVIIGPDQAEGVHCVGPCVIENVWWEDVCEDALTIKGDVPGDVSYVRGGGAKHAQDKMLQHNGCGHLDVQDFYAYDWGKVYRSCGNCSTMCRRTASFNNVIAVAGKDMFCGVNSGYKDICSVANLSTDIEDICNGSSNFDGKVCVQAGPIITLPRLSSTSRPASTKTTKTSSTRTSTRTSSTKTSSTRTSSTRTSTRTTSTA